MGDIKSLLLSLENKYTPISLVQILEKKYTFIINEEEKCEPELLKETKFVLSNNIESNEKFIKKLIEGADELIKKVNLSEEDIIPAKIFDNYKNQLNKILGKKIESGEKLADSLCGCIKRTILKLLNLKKFGTEILNYLKTNGFEVDLFEKGHKLSDDDLCFLDENLLQAYKEITENSDDNYRVIDMVQPIIKLFYIDEDDDEIYSSFLPGICKYFVKEVE